MNNLKKYSIIISIIGAVVILVQILATHFNLSLDQNIIIEVASVIIAILISIGVIKKQSASTNIKDISEQVKQDLQNTTNPTQTKPTDTQTLTQEDNKTETDDN